LQKRGNKRGALSKRGNKGEERVLESLNQDLDVPAWGVEVY